jgi:integrase/recombinase XerD
MGNLSISLATVATEFLDRPGLAKSTLQSYELTLMPLLQQYGSCPVETLNRPLLESYLNGLNHLAYTTHNRHQAILQSLFNFAVDQGYLASNPIIRLKRRKPNQLKGEYGSDEVIRYLSSSQIEVLYSLLERNSRLHTLVLLLHRTGARISEALALNFDDLDLAHCKFRVLGKGNKQRWCFYGQDLEQVLEQYLRLYRHPNCPALFTAQQPFTRKVKRLSYRAAHNDWVHLIGQDSALQGSRLHDLRHTFATERVGLMGIEELRALMGHTNIQTTLRYQKVTSSRAEEVAKRALEVLIKSKTVR